MIKIFEKSAVFRKVTTCFFYFYFLLTSYFILRPIREEMGIRSGVDFLPVLYSFTFIVMALAVPLYGYVVKCFPKRKIVPFIYLFFLVHLVLFYATLRFDFGGLWAARIFFVWLSVFNLFVVSIFWSVMSEIFERKDALRFYGIIAGAGSAGALTGPLLTAWLVKSAGVVNLILISIVLLMAAIGCLLYILRFYNTLHAQDSDKVIGGKVFEGVTLLATSKYLKGIAVFVLLYSLLSTFFYFEQAHLLKDIPNSEERTGYFAKLDLAVNVLALVIQLFVTSYLFTRKKLSSLLASVPLTVTICVLLLGLIPGLMMLAVSLVFHRAGNFSVSRPGKETIYTLLNDRERFKSKNFIDTFVFRGGDAVSSWIVSGLIAGGLSMTTLAWMMIPITLLWAVIGYRLGQISENNKRFNKTTTEL